MKREEEIAKYCEDMGFPLGSCSSINSIKALTASDAIKWADETMIYKACEWLIDNAKNYIVVSGGGYWYDSVKLKHSFKKAMKEE